MGADREDLPTVLFVHADRVAQELVAGSLGDEFNVVGATARAAVASFERHAPAVVVLDAELAGPNADELYARMRRVEPALRAVFLDGGDDPRRALRLGDLGV
ncbi:MAG TPA: hypothetical protein VHB21_03165, partial [Minicystis sp.]|nr:hypothetical protein [Minicystis sp.]